MRIKWFLVLFISISINAKDGFITADIGFAEHGGDKCTVHLEITNNTNNLFVEMVLYGELLVFDKDGIMVKHGMSSFDKNNELYMPIPKRVFKSGETVVVDRDINTDFWRNNDSQCSLISELEFSLKRARGKDRDGNSVEFSNFLDSEKKKYQVEELQVLNW